jgi:hypothetical protein
VEKLVQVQKELLSRNFDDGMVEKLLQTQNEMLSFEHEVWTPLLSSV